MTDQLTITISGPQGSGKTLLGGAIINHLQLAGMHLDLTDRGDLTEISVTDTLRKAATVIGTQRIKITGVEEKRPVDPDREMDAAMVDAGMMSTADFVKAHGEPKTDGTGIPLLNDHRAAADRVRKAVDALNDAVLAAKDQEVFCEFSAVDYGSFAGNTQIVTVTCSARI